MPEAPTLESTITQMPALSERLTPLQRTLAESYQRVFMRGNRPDDLLILTGLINEIADAPLPKKLRGSDIGCFDADEEEFRQIDESLLKFEHPDAGEPETRAGLIDFILECYNEYVSTNKQLGNQLKALQESEKGLTEKLRCAQEAAEQSEGKYQALVAVMGKHFGNHPEFHVSDDLAEYLDRSLLHSVGSIKETDAYNLLQNEITLLKDQLKDAAGIINSYESLHNEFRPKLEPFFGRQALTESIDDCFRNLVARHIRNETGIQKAREILISVLGESQVDGVSFEDAVMVLKGRYSGSCARIKQLEAQIGSKAGVSERVIENGQHIRDIGVGFKSELIVDPPSPAQAVVEVQEEPKLKEAAEAKRGPGRPKKPVFVEQTDLSDLAKKFYLRGVPVLGDLRKHLPNVAQLAYGDGLTVTSIAKSLQIGLSDASDVLRVVDACLEVKRETEATQADFMAALEEVAH
jgi:hypothetical protein